MPKAFSLIIYCVILPVLNKEVGPKILCRENDKKNRSFYLRLFTEMQRRSDSNSSTSVDSVLLKTEPNESLDYVSTHIFLHPIHYMTLICYQEIDTI